VRADERIEKLERQIQDIHAKERIEESNAACSRWSSD
jgi:hypothetical protein